MSTDCPVCNNMIDTISDTEKYCTRCRSVVLLGKDKEPIKVISGIEFNTEAFIIGILIPIGYLFFFLFLHSPLLSIIDTGLILFFPSFALVLRSFILGRFDYDGIIGSYIALFSGRLKYYDFGSKVALFSCILFQVTGLILIVIGLLNN